MRELLTRLVELVVLAAGTTYICLGAIAFLVVRSSGRAPWR
jgi:hypothetical protein